MKIPEIREIGRLTLPPYDTIVLPNGLQVHTVLGDNAEVCRLSILLPGGDADSPKPSMLTLANMLMAEGTGRWSGEEIADRLDFEGAWWAPSITTHHSLLNFFSLSDKMDSITATALEMLTDATFPASAVENSRAMMAGRLEVKMRQVDYVTSEARNKQIFRPGSLMAESPTPEMVNGYTPEEIMALHYSRIVPSQMHCCISGSLSDSSLQLILDRLAALTPSAEHFELQPLGFRDSYADERMDIEMEGAVQSSVRISVPTIGREHPDFIAVRFAVMALGGSFGSRLMSNIREEKGLTYGINASLSGYPEMGVMNISCQTRSPEQVIAECEREIVRLADPSSYTEEEVTRLRRYILSGLASTLDTAFSRMDFLQTRITSATPADYFALQEEMARRIDGRLLAAAAADHLQSARLITVAG